MNEERVLPRKVILQLAEGFEERQALDVAHRPPHFDHADLRFSLFRGDVDKSLDLVGYVGDNLHGLAQKGSRSLLADDVPVDLTSGNIVGRGERLVEETFVATNVQVSLLPIVCHKHLAVLVGVHRPRIHVHVGVDLLQADAISAQFEQQGDRCSNDPLSQPGDDSTTYNDELAQH